MKKLLLSGALACAAMTVSAQVAPKVAPEVPVNGGKYVLVNKAQSADQYTTRTSWDGAVYFLGKEDSHYADYAVTAYANENGTWSFAFMKSESVETEDVDSVGNPITETVEVPQYILMPEGNANLNANPEIKAEWKLEATANGFYNLIPGEGNFGMLVEGSEETPTGDYRLHLNNGKQYFVITYRGNSWFPDLYGGITEDYDEAHDIEKYFANDSTSFNWGFVSLEKIDAYYADMKYVATLNSYYNGYCDLDEYGEGFKASYNAALAIYNSSDDAETLAGMFDILNAKEALYKAIEKAIATNESDNATLNAAIEAAMTAFNTLTAVADVEAATATITKATEDYSLNTGDFTAYGKNMSFEDLSAQGGNQTSSVAGAPAGWNVYINGKQAVTADDVKAGGIGAWHGVNNDAEGEPMDGAVAFGLWNGAVPQYEISQTIEGLENGTYIVSAGLMAGSNGSGSRLSTQRIFGNLNSTYYGSLSDYNQEELDQTELYDFAYNEILTTDRVMKPVEVRAYVYDGTLTFGVRTDGNAAAAVDNFGNGGTGWFKVDNFRIVYDGYRSNDAIAILNHYMDTFDSYDEQSMPEATYENMSSKLGAFRAVNDNSPAETINNAIVDAKNLIGEVSVAVKAYDRLREAIEKHLENVDIYDSKAGIGAYIEVIEEIQDSLTDCYYAVEDIDGAIARLNAALEECITSDTIEPGMDLTEYIKNPSFEDLSAQGGNNSDGVANPPAGWNLYVDGEQCKTSAEMNAAGISNWCAINSGDNLNITNIYGEEVTHQYTDGDHLWGIWAGAVPVLELSQTIKNLPAGTYTITADVVVQNDWAGYNLGTQRIFANEYVCMYGAEEDYIQNSDDSLFAAFPKDIKDAKMLDDENTEVELKHLTYAGNYVNENYGASGAPYTTKITMGLAEMGDLTFGIRTSRLSAVDGEISSQASMGWFKVDNWTLTYESDEVPAGAELTGIANVNSSKTEVMFYNVNGIRLAAPQKGINIVKIGNNVKKVLVK